MAKFNLILSYVDYQLLTSHFFIITQKGVYKAFYYRIYVFYQFTISNQF
jgi:hypothetical protein